MSMPKAERALLLERAVANHHAGDLSAAAALYQRVLQSNPSDPDALNLLGIALHQAGDSNAGVQYLRAAVKARRKDPALHYNLGTLLIELGEYAEAEAALRNALKLGSSEPHLEMNLANALALQGRHAQALPFYEAARKRTPRSSQVWFNYGNALRDLDRAEPALAAYEQATAIDPNNMGAWTNKGQLLHRMERLEEAEHAYRRACALGNSDAEILCSLAQILEHQGRAAEAERFARQALERRPDYVPTLKVLASVLCKRYCYDEAEQHLRRLVALDEADWTARSALSGLLRDCGNVREALEVLDSPRVVPDEALKAFSTMRSLAFMRLGDCAQAWQDLRFHSDEPEAEGQPARIRKPLPENLRGERIYVERDQGLGDELFFLRFMPQLRARGAHVIYRCGAKLLPLLARSGVVDEVCDQEPAAGEFAFSLDVSNLPWALQAGAAFDPAPPALRLDPEQGRASRFRDRLAALGSGPYLGLTWHAGTPLEHQQGIKGRVLTKEMEPVLLGQALRDVPGTLVALQRGLRADELEALQAACGRPVHDFGPWNEDLDDALALLAALDDYIGVSNTNMHLVAALGRRAKVLVTFPPEWRWSAGGERCAFFPGFALYAQARDGSWTEALARLRADLAAG